jgi:protein-S-isoprenylcysteine O-methyltransferase Ste14
MSERTLSWKDHVPATFSSILFISQIIVGIYLLSEVSQIEFLAYAGVGLYAFSGMVFGALPVFEFRKKGGVRKGQSYIHTTKLVDTGIYSVVRHPQYVTFIMWAISGMLLFQHWIVILLGVPVIPLTYIDLIRADSIFNLWFMNPKTILQNLNQNIFVKSSYTFFLCPTKSTITWFWSLSIS